MRRLIPTMSLVAALIAGPASAQTAMTLDDYVLRANRLPQNPAALLMPDYRRLERETNRAFDSVGREIREARSAGRTPPACPPERINLDLQQYLGFLNGIPQARRRGMSVPDGVRAWMASRYPCG